MTPIARARRASSGSSACRGSRRWATSVRVVSKSCRSAQLARSDMSAMPVSLIDSSCKVAWVASRASSCASSRSSACRRSIASSISRSTVTMPTFSATGATCSSRYSETSRGASTPHGRSAGPARRGPPRPGPWPRPGGAGAAAPGPHGSDPPRPGSTSPGRRRTRRGRLRRCRGSTGPRRPGRRPGSAGCRRGTSPAPTRGPRALVEVGVRVGPRTRQGEQLGFGLGACPCTVDHPREQRGGGGQTVSDP